MGGVAGTKPPVPALAWNLLILLSIGLPAALSAPCTREMATSSPMFGAKWAENFVLYTQDYNWKTSGDITKVNLYFGESEGCVKGIKAQYGADPANAQRLGVETKALLTRSMQLRNGERIVRAEYKSSGRCIEYLSLRTNQGRQLAVGKHDSPTPTAFAAPTNPGGYLAYINGHTAKPMANPHVGKLMQLQLVWAASSCDSSSGEGGAVSVSAAASSAGGAGTNKKKSKKGSGSGSVQASLASVSEGEAAADSSDSSSSSEPKCVGNHLCANGKCATSSCMLAGIGSEVSNMMCLGTNMRLPFLSSGIDTSPCSFLGCKLDTASCTSSGLMGVGGFCTGRVVAMGAEAMLHPQGKQWLGYPCVEHKSPTLGLRASMLGEMTSAEDMVAKSWKVCDCVKKTPLRNSLAIMMPNGTITSYIFGKTGGEQQQQQQQQQQPATVAVPLMPVFDMSTKDVVTQWLAAKAGNAALPTATISAQLATDLKQLIPGFMTPSLMVANTSAALMTHPAWMSEIPVFTLPNAALTALKAFLPDLTSLPTLALGPNMTTAEASVLLELPQNLLVSDITVDILPALAAKLGLPTFLKLNPSTSTSKVDSKSDAGPHLVPLDQMHIGNVVVQWATAVSRKAPLPTLVLGGKEQLQKLQEKVPGLVTPSIIVTNISQALLFKPAAPGLPVFVLPAELTGEVMGMLPDITSLPSFLVLPEQAKEKLPDLALTDFIAPNMRVMVETLGPSIPMLLNFVAMNGPTLNVSMAGLAETPALQALMISPWGHLLSTLSTDIPDLLVDASSLDMGSIGQVVGAVKDALTTSGFKLPYLSMTDDTLQKWGVKKIEGFVTNVVTRAVTPREDPSLIDNSDDDSEDGSHDHGRSSAKSGKMKRRYGKVNRKQAASGDNDNVHTAQQHNNVAATISALKEEETALESDDAGSPANSPPKATNSPPKEQQQKEDKKQDPKQQQQQQQPQDVTSEEIPSEEYIPEDEYATEIQQQKQQQHQEQGDGQSKAALSAASPTNSDKTTKPTGHSSSSSSKPGATAGKKAAGTKDAEPPLKPAYNPANASTAATAPSTAAGAAAETAAAAAGTASSGAPVPIQDPTAAVAGTPVPTTANPSKQPAAATPPQKKAPAAATLPLPTAKPTPAPAAAPTLAPAAGQQLRNPIPSRPLLDRTQLEQLGKKQAAAAVAQPPIPFGTEDEDGAIIVDVVEARRAFMTEEQWASVDKGHQETLLRLLDVEA